MGGQPGFGQQPPPGAAPMGMGMGMGMGGAAALANVGNPMAPMAAGAKPTVRNPTMVLVIPLALMFGGVILSVVLGMIASILSLVGTLVTLAGVGYLLVQMIGMLRELGNYTQDSGFNWWFIFIPCLNYYFMWLKVPEQVTNAKNKAGILAQKPTRGIVLYVLLFPWALANDLNDIAQS
jgi:hypothetical protein